MSFTKVLYDHINGLSLTNPLAYGTAEGVSAPYYVMLKVSGIEQPDLLCEEQGTQGHDLYQFSVYVGSQTGTGSAAGAEISLELLKNKVNKIWGTIGTTEQYNIWNNVTNGVRAFDAESLNTWSAIFETEIWWKKI